jgi:hypothetical protein
MPKYFTTKAPPDGQFKVITTVKVVDGLICYKSFIGLQYTKSTTRLHNEKIIQKFCKFTLHDNLTYIGNELIKISILWKIVQVIFNLN